MVNRTLVLVCRLVIVLAGGLTLACDRQPPAGPSAPGVLSVTTISPATGWTDAATIVSIGGTGFVSGTRALLDGTPTDTTFYSSTLISVRMAPHEVGPVAIAVSNPNGVTVSVPQRFTYIETPLLLFTEPASGLSTSDVRDAQGQIVQFDQRGQLIWTPDGTKLPGFVRSDEVFVNAEHVCGCWFEVRFGTEDGERRAYLTADWIHDNPGTVVDLDVRGGALIVTRGTAYPPGSFTLSGLVTEETTTGVLPVADAWVEILVGGGWRSSQTAANGAYEIRGLYPSTPVVHVVKPGFQTSMQAVAIAGSTMYDIKLLRQTSAEAGAERR